MVVKATADILAVAREVPSFKGLWVGGDELDLHGGRENREISFNSTRSLTASVA